MAIQLSKGQGINLSKDHGVNGAKIEVTFDVDPSHPVKKHEMDVNACAFVLKGKKAQRDEDFVFYNNLSSADGSVTHEKDGGSIGDDIMHVDFSKLDASAEKPDEVSVIAEIYEGLTRGHHFGQFAHCTAHIVHPDTGEVIAEFKLTEDDSNATAVQMGSFTKDADGHWHFHAVGTGYQKGLADFLTVYGLVAADEE